ncbi:hypothetical protein M569_01015, partial [Genlisea aurea]
DESRPSIGFPIGTAILLLLIFTLSGIISFCYHWNKLRNILSPTNPNSHVGNSPPPHHLNANGKLTVIVMPGDDFPKFVALPCPCQPPWPER